jgi:hypothetical protein
MADADPLVAFLRERIAEDVAAARAAYRPGGDGPWIVDVSPSGRATVWQRRPEREAASTLPPDVHLAPVVGTAQIDNGREVCEHIARHDPARVLADAAAKTALLDWAATEPEAAHDSYYYGEANAREHVLRLMAQPYRHGPDGQPHPGWQDEWTIR